jgi:glycerophosphoryl diester phosphodiesterase
MRATILVITGLALAACAERTRDAALAADPPGWRTSVATDLNAFFDCLAAAKASLVSAHRGGPKPGFPENAIETFAETLKSAPAILETDIATSADGVLFLHHDDTLARTTTGEGDTATMTWDEIATLKLEDARGAPTAFSPARLDDALAWAEGRAILALDIKRSTRYEDVATAVVRAGAERRVFLIAYTAGQAEKLHRLLPETMISLNLASQSDLNRAVASGVPADRLIAFAGLEAVDPRLYGTFAGQGVEIAFGTLGGRESIDAEIAAAGDDGLYAELSEAGVDVIATDRPAAAARALAEAGRGPAPGACGISKS